MMSVTAAGLILVVYNLVCVCMFKRNVFECVSERAVARGPRPAEL